MTESMVRQYTVVVEFLGKTLGPDYEVSLHDLRTGSIVAIANGRMSGRNTGSPISVKTQSLLADKEYEHGDYVLHFPSQLANGKKVRSSTMFIKDDTGAPVGVLCINFDDTRFQDLYNEALRMLHPNEYANLYCETVLPLDAHSVTQELISTPPALPLIPSAPKEEAPSEHLHNDVSSLMQEIFAQVAADLSVPPDRLTQEERIQFVAQLNERGMFRLKGAIQYATEQLACSQASVYRYLSKAKAQQD